MSEFRAGEFQAAHKTNEKPGLKAEGNVLGSHFTRGGGSTRPRAASHLPRAQAVSGVPPLTPHFRLQGLGRHCRAPPPQRHSLSRLAATAQGVSPVSSQGVRENGTAELFLVGPNGTRGQSNGRWGVAAGWEPKHFLFL